MDLGSELLMSQKGQGASYAAKPTYSVYVYTFVYVHMYVYIYVYMCICVYVYILVPLSK